MPLRFLLSAALVAALSVAGVSGQTMPAAPSPGQPALTALNNAFRAAYADAKSRVLASAGPTLIVNGDRFSLLRKTGREEANAGTPLYDAVKAIAHVPLAIYVTLTPGEGAIDTGRIQTLTNLRALIPPAEEGLDAVKLPPETLARQRRIVGPCLAFIDELVSKREFKRSELVAFTRRMTPLVMQNVADATRAQLDATHAVVLAWRRELSPREWEQLHVIVIGPHMPREDLVVMQYFLRLLHEPAEGRRVIYAESLWEEPQALDLLGTHLLDGNVSEAFFGDFMRMHRDLLGDAAKAYLPKLLPE